MQDYMPAVESLANEQTGIISFIIYFVSVIALWRVFSKAGEFGLWAFVPIVNAYKLCKIADGNGFKFLLYFIPIVNVIFYVLLNIRMAWAFGKSTLFGILMIFIPIIPVYILAFGSAEYIGPRGERY